MDMRATGEPVMTHADPQVRVGVHIEQGTCVLAQGGTDFTAYHAWVEFAAPDEKPWSAEKVEFSATRPDGRSVGLTVDLLNDACDGPRDDVPNAIWKVVTLAATSAGDVGIRYTAPTS
ncbi:hypothetical protein [Streptomyces sp. gb14]|uniref:hypothetical protein n=1 Tax=Streptomyces sp. gb14 TaxID=1827753 RepID=UPI000BF08FE0|nr:hypothetical protein [Streptomyces sp. gb14]